MARNNNFTPTFRKYADMTDGEKAAFRQGATMVDNSVKERLGLKKPRGQKPSAVAPIPAQKPTIPTPSQKPTSPNDSFYKHYQQLKAKYKGSILFLRIGDFYEVLGEDAKTVSKALDLTLTARSIGDSRIPMCGVPYHALNNYVAKLTQDGYKVAIADETTRR